jgi:benzoyl-CoA reductase subunit B
MPSLTAQEKERSLRRYKMERDHFASLLEAVLPIPGEEFELYARQLEILLDSKAVIVDCVENDKPFIGGYFCNAPELFSAMDLPWFMVMETPFLASSEPYVLQEIDNTAQMGLGTDLCTAIRLPIYYISEGLMPVPTAALGLLYPCDGAPMLHQVMQHNKNWKNVPLYSCDPPYTSDERAVNYFADELKRMAEFLEKHTGATLEIDRLRTACEESNAAYRWWQEYNELRRNVPSPHGWSPGGSMAFAMAQCFKVGDPRSTAWFEQLYRCAENRVKAGKGASDAPGWKERIRLFWFDILPMGWLPQFMPWLEEEWGAVLVMDMFGNYPYTLIDTTNEDTIFHDLAKRNLLDAPMIRQARGTADNFSNDIRRIVKDYKIDCVIWPGHMGHKDGSAASGIMRQTCRELGVPFLQIGLDLFDPRYTSVDEVKDKVSEFFSAMGLG